MIMSGKNEGKAVQKAITKILKNSGDGSAKRKRVLSKVRGHPNYSFWLPKANDGQAKLGMLSSRIRLLSLVFSFCVSVRLYIYKRSDPNIL